MAQTSVKVLSPKKDKYPIDADGYIFFCPSPKQRTKALPARAVWQKACAEYTAAAKFKWKENSHTSFDFKPAQRFVIAVLPKSKDMFELLGFARACMASLHEKKCRHVVIDLSNTIDLAPALADAFVSAFELAAFKAKKQTKTDEKPSTKVKLSLIAEGQDVSIAAKRGLTSAESTNRVRTLAMRPANDLTCKSYVDELREYAKESGLGCKVLKHSKLESMGAGAFCAVAQGSAHKEAAIVQLSYKAGKDAPNLALVGKGIVYDTGGVCLKPPRYMFGMEGDMTGSAVVWGVLATAVRESWPVNIDAWFAIADNAIGDRAYRPNEVVSTLSGKTIETVHTDAEGRMALADTLFLASEAEPDLILDFATLTGSAVAAIGTNYSAGFTNQPDLNDAIRLAGAASGERVWPFPMNDDYAECLDSDIADIKQCRLSSGPDHIEAAKFLENFVGKSKWVHVDLAACENDGGLGAVGTKVTGFGVRFAAEFCRSHFDF